MKHFHNANFSSFPLVQLLSILVHICMACRKSLVGSEGEYYAFGSRPLLDDIAVLSPLLIASVSLHAIAF